ncbi:MAG TPA: hypothetical protein VEU08_23655, partial [Vicinamibacterales bacterium]|nr:hypothetical protein [Vicinamibacterales bacterium]
TQERKASSFVFTPLYCGFSPSKAKEVDEETESGRRPGYHSTEGYSHPSGPHIGTAMAISGAAANPNSGFHTSGPMAFLLTVFDARLGWWLGNPRDAKASGMPGPIFSLKYLMDELTAQTTALTPFVNLSDGGHFDNLGLYELVRRRCRYIVVGDAEQDPGMTFEGLGGAIRKCRADFGVEIDLVPDPIRIDVNGVSRAHCVVGSITYPEMETGHAAPFCNPDATITSGRARGWIVYLKSSVTGDEPADVLEYRSSHPDFPQETTVDQFFSESQFESYRRLGLHVGRTAFEGVQFIAKPAQTPAEMLLANFQQLARNWYASPEVETGAATNLTERYTDLMRQLGDKEIKALEPQLVFGDAKAVAMTPELNTFMLEAIQLMEDVFNTFHLEFEANRANPRIAGWMIVFKRWCGSPAFTTVWPKVQSEYNPLFREFAEAVTRATSWPPDLPSRP